jgi:phage host-nuclease inhibitor protein Gam
MGVNIETLGDLQNVNKVAKSRINEEYSNAIGPYANQSYIPMDVDGNSIIAKRVRDLKNRFTDITPEGTKAKDLIEENAGYYDLGKPHTLGDLDRERTQLNAELSNHSALNPNVRYTKEHGNVQLLIDNTIKDALRDTVYPYADQLAGRPAGYFENLKQQQMNQIRLETLLHDRIQDLTGRASAERGKSAIERARIGAAAGSHGNVHGWASGLKDVAIPDELLKPANRAVKKAFSKGNPVAKGAILSLPLRELLWGEDSSLPQEQSSAPKKRVAAAMTR